MKDKEEKINFLDTELKNLREATALVMKDAKLLQSKVNSLEEINKELNENLKNIQEKHEKEVAGLKQTVGRMRASFEHDKKQLISMNRIDTAIFEQVVKKYEENIQEII